MMYIYQKISTTHALLTWPTLQRPFRLRSGQVSKPAPRGYARTRFIVTSTSIRGKLAGRTRAVCCKKSGCAGQISPGEFFASALKNSDG